MTTFRDFIFGKYQAFEQSLWEKSRERATVTKFSRYIDENQGDVSHWLNGTREPKGRVIDRLAKKWGPEVYEVLGKVEPMPKSPLLRKVLSLMDNMSPEGQEEVARMVEEKAAEERNSSNQSDNQRTNFSLQMS